MTETKVLKAVLYFCKDNGFQSGAIAGRLELTQLVRDLSAKTTRVDLLQVYADTAWEVCDELHTEVEEAEERCAAWCDVAMKMIQELRNDYAPGDLGELDGVKAIRKLRAKNAEMCEALEFYADQSNWTNYLRDKSLLYIDHGEKAAAVLAKVTK